MNMSREAAEERMLEDAYAEFSTCLRKRDHKGALKVVRHLKDIGYEGNAHELWIRWWVSKEKKNARKSTKKKSKK